jgi:hypothetical protein
MCRRRAMGGDATGHSFAQIAKDAIHAPPGRAARRSWPWSRMNARATGETVQYPIFGSGAVSRPQVIYLGFGALCGWLFLSTNMGVLGRMSRNILPGSLYAISAGPPGALNPKNLLACCIPTSTGRGFSRHASVKIRSLYRTSHNVLTRNFDFGSGSRRIYTPPLASIPT